MSSGKGSAGASGWSDEPASGIWLFGLRYGPGAEALSKGTSGRTEGKSHRGSGRGTGETGASRIFEDYRGAHGTEGGWKLVCHGRIPDRAADAGGQETAGRVLGETGNGLNRPASIPGGSGKKHGGRNPGKAGVMRAQVLNLWECPR